MRKLKTRDVPAFCRVLKQTGLQNKLGELAAEAGSGADETALGMKLIQAVIEAAAEKNTEDCVYAFLAPIFEISPEELADLDLGEFFAGLKQMSAENDLLGFFGSAAALMR